VCKVTNILWRKTGRPMSTPELFLALKEATSDAGADGRLADVCKDLYRCWTEMCVR
jgi:hypothetical protein